MKHTHLKQQAHNKIRNYGEMIRKIIVFAMLGTMMFVSDILMEFLPNVHIVGVLTVTYTLVYRKLALVPIYVYVFLNGLYGGFGLWWIPYCYLWTILWAMTMILPKKMSSKIAVPIYMLVCSLHGLLFGTLYAPFQALAFGLSFDAMIAWIISGLPWDLVHAVGNLVAGVLIFPLSTVLARLENKFSRSKVIVE